MKDRKKFTATKPTKNPLSLFQNQKSKNTKKGNKISDAKITYLESLFLMDGITAYQAAKLADVDIDTAQRYFDDFTEQLLREDEYETWAYRQKRVRARSLEGITKKILFVSQQRAELERTLSALLYYKNGKDVLISIPVDEMDHTKILRYNTSIMALTEQLIELQAQFDAIDSTPPADVILQHEINQMIKENTHQYITAENENRKDEAAGTTATTTPAKKKKKA